MRLFLDTSAWVKYFIAEVGTRELQCFLLQQSQNPECQIYASVVTYAEMHATFTRAWKGNRLISDELESIRNAFDVQWHNIELLEHNLKMILHAAFGKIVCVTWL